jgi:hypothetical protein
LEGNFRDVVDPLRVLALRDDEPFERLSGGWMLSILTTQKQEYGHTSSPALGALLPSSRVLRILHPVQRSLCRFGL